MNRNKNLLFAAVLSCSALLASRAFAQGGPIELQMFRPAMDSKGHFSVDSTQVLGHMKISFGFGVTNAFKPLELSGNDREFAVNNLVSATLQFAIGLFQHFEVGVGLPFSIVMGQTDPVDDGNPDGRWNQGANPSKIESAPMNYDQQGKFASQGIGDGYFNFKWRILPAAKGPVGLAAMFSMAFPTGNDAAFLGSGGLTLAPKFIVDKRLSRGRMLLSANLGARLRTGGDHVLTANAGWDTCNTWTARNGEPCTFDGTMDNNMTQNVSQVNDVTYGLGFTWRLTNKVELVSEMFGSTELSSLGKDAEPRHNDVDGNYTLEYTKKVMPLEALAGLKLYLAASSYLAVGGGVGLTGIAGMDHVGAPDFRLFAVFSFEPFIGDRDGDGIPDDIDKCPDDPEDFDGFQDEDGCPDLDNDKDGIPDSLDKCPNDPETFNNFEDEDGCPDDVTSDRDGDGILDNKDQCPDNPEDFDGFEDEDGCPEEDNDGDSVMDIKDLCPGKDVDKKNAFEMTKEDFDSWQDEDGCPDPDNDGDGLLDKVDKCPNEPETFNGFEDEDGCPDEGKVRVTAGKIEIYEKIYFATNKAEILPESFGILDAIAATLKAHPNILKVEIQGHTDDRNTDEYNLKLSDDRANAVRDYLIDKGIAPSRLIAKGYGESRPIDKRTTEEARAKNRRVEFIILERGDSKGR